MYQFFNDLATPIFHFHHRKTMFQFMGHQKTIVGTYMLLIP